MPRLVVLGGSGASTPELADALAAWPGGSDRRPPLEVVLLGRDAAKLDLVAAAFAARARSSPGPDLSVRATTDLAAALDGAHAILQQVRVGGLAARVFDETFPREEGIPGEETMGPGGFANALRTVPALRPAWEAIARLAPDALVIDLTNPAGIVTAAAVRESGLAVVSVCDSPITITDAVAERLGRDMASVRRAYVGGNHFGWWVADDTAELEAVAGMATGVAAEDVLEMGALPAPYGRYYLVPERIARSQGGGPTRAEQLMALERQLLAGYATEQGAAGSRTPDGAAAGPGAAASAAPGAAASSPLGPRRGAVWYARAVVPLLAARWTDGTSTLIVGLVHDGSVRGLPAGVVIERAAAVSAGRIEPFATPALPAFAAALLHAHLAYEGLVVDALAAGAPRRALVGALAANPMVRDLDRAGRLVDTILARSPRG